MPKRIELKVIEDIKYLKNLGKTISSHRLKIRLLYLELRKINKFPNQEDLAKYLGVSADSLHRWTLKYNKGGIEELLSIKSGKNTNTKIPKEVHDLIEKKLQNLEDPLLGYKHAVNWLYKKTGIKINYHTLRGYMKRHFGSKLKVPRKSHYKKEPEAELVFKKPT